MSGEKIGYIRVSTADQKEARQLDGLELDKIFLDRASGRDTNRPQLQELLRYVREGDHVVVHSMDRLARNLDDLRRLVRQFSEMGVKVQFLKEGIIFAGEEAPMSNLLLSVMGAFAEFETALIRERQLEGIAAAKKRGAFKGRPHALTQDKIEYLSFRVKKGDHKADIARDLNISRPTVYKYMKMADR